MPHLRPILELASFEQFFFISSRTSFFLNSSLHSYPCTHDDDNDNDDDDDDDDDDGDDDDDDDDEDVDDVDDDDDDEVFMEAIRSSFTTKLSGYLAA